MPDYAKARETMVDRQIRTATVTDHAVLAAFLDVPREPFLPPALRPFAYSDADLALTTGPGPRRTMMEPSVLARMVELAQVTPDAVVLEVGCGTGYASAVLARLASSVVALESDVALASTATTTLINLDILNVAVVSGSLEAGYASEGPYDAIILGGSVEVLPPALLSQLKEGGRLVAPVGGGLGGLVWLYRRSDGEVSGRPVFNAAVPPLPGFARPKAFAF